MSSNNKTRAWLARVAPHHLKAIDDEGEEHVIAVSAKKNRHSDALRAAKAQGAVRIDCYNAKNELLDSRDLEDEDDDDEKGATLEAEVTRTGSDIAVILPMILDACDRAASRHQEAYAMAFAQQGAITKLISDRLASLEKAWHSVIMAQQQAAEDSRADSAADGSLDDMAKTVIQGAMKGFGDRMNGASPTTPAGSIPDGGDNADS